MGGLGTILGAVNFITTIVCMRAPGMTMVRMPVFTWMNFVTMILVLIVFPVLAAALLAPWADRHRSSSARSRPACRSCWPCSSFCTRSFTDGSATIRVRGPA